MRSQLRPMAMRKSATVARQTRRGEPLERPGLEPARWRRQGGPQAASRTQLRPARLASYKASSARR